ncbi:MAG: translation initiation factor IF-2 subunit beta [Thermoplasmata archaeon]|nr:MAG: translation initiation factor IF-2 subunit beta [Thermoplasmata archaeon]HDO69644.1 translation initiation factor IF-2 subunit beta [Thermoplasmatales archaeon]HEX17559.1 translation initiation factor IF-2 subunit beta [Thermoplasmatales archaeon]
MYDYKSLLKRLQEDESLKRLEDRERFVIPKVDVVYEGRTTILRNFEKILSALNRDADHLLKFFLKELGTAGEKDGPRAIFQGKIPAHQIQSKLEDYVEIFVLCQECGRPDTHLIKKDRLLLVRCDACGAIRSVTTRKKRGLTEKEVLEEGKVYEVVISDIGKKGDGIAHYGRYTIYVPNAVRGSKVKVKIEKISGTLAFARLVE